MWQRIDEIHLLKQSGSSVAPDLTQWQLKALVLLPSLKKHFKYEHSETENECICGRYWMLDVHLTLSHV